MKTFEIQYVIRYYEEKDYCSEIIFANCEEEALISFANIFGIQNYKSFFKPFFMWENGQWMGSFKCINEIKEQICPTCNGSGKILIKK